MVRSAGGIISGYVVSACVEAHDPEPATILAVELEESVKENSDKVAQAVEEVTTDKMEHYIIRGIQEVSQCVEDLNYEVDGILSDKGTKINGISLSDNGSCVVKLTRTLTVTDPNKIDSVSSKSRMFSIPDRFATYVKWSITMPQNIMAPFVTISCEVTIPSDMVSSMIGGGDPNEEYKKSIAAVEKFAKDLVKQL